MTISFPLRLRFSTGIYAITCWFKKASVFIVVRIDNDMTDSPFKENKKKNK